MNMSLRLVSFFHSCVWASVPERVSSFGRDGSVCTAVLLRYRTSALEYPMYAVEQAHTQHPARVETQGIRDDSSTEKRGPQKADCVYTLVPPRPSLFSLLTTRSGHCHRPALTLMAGLSLRQLPQKAGFLQTPCMWRAAMKSINWQQPLFVNGLDTKIIVPMAMFSCSAAPESLPSRTCA